MLVGTARKIVKDELRMVEHPIYGEFKKFNSNSGWSSGEGNLPGAFSHWTWVESNGEHLICDLQGHRGLPGGIKTTDGSSSYYAFSDPAVLSKVSGSYGPTDLGEEGQKIWFPTMFATTFASHLAWRVRSEMPANPLRRPNPHSVQANPIGRHKQCLDLTAF